MGAFHQSNCASLLFIHTKTYRYYQALKRRPRRPLFELRNVSRASRTPLQYADGRQLSGCGYGGLGSIPPCRVSHATVRNVASSCRPHATGLLPHVAISSRLHFDTNAPKRALGMAPGNPSELKYVPTFIEGMSVRYRRYNCLILRLLPIWMATLVFTQ